MKQCSELTCLLTAVKHHVYETEGGDLIHRYWCPEHIQAKTIMIWGKAHHFKTSALLHQEKVVCTKDMSIGAKVDAMMGEAAKDASEAFRTTGIKCVDCGSPTTVAVFEDNYCTSCYDERTKRINFKVRSDDDTSIRLNDAPTGGTSIQEQYKQIGGTHYGTNIDPITFAIANFTPAEVNGFYKTNIIKYVARCDRKNGLEDLHKAKDYLDRLIKAYEKQGKVDEDVTTLYYGDGTITEEPVQSGITFKDAWQMLCSRKETSVSKENPSHDDIVAALEDYLMDLNIAYSTNETKYWTSFEIKS